MRYKNIFNYALAMYLIKLFFFPFLAPIAFLLGIFLGIEINYGNVGHYINLIGPQEIDILIKLWLIFGTLISMFNVIFYISNKFFTKRYEKIDKDFE